MRAFILALSIFSFTASAESLICLAKQNSTVVFEKRIDLEKSKIFVGEVEQFQIFVQKISNIVSIEVFDPNIPSRQYAEGSADLGLKWVLWNRDILLEVECKK